jgi:hypothetical protein
LTLATFPVTVNFEMSRGCTCMPSRRLAESAKLAESAQAAEAGMRAFYVVNPILVWSD